MEETRIDLGAETPEERKNRYEKSVTIWKFNNSMPFSDEHFKFLDELIPNRGKNVKIIPPIYGGALDKVKIGNNVFMMSGCLMMGFGGIVIDDDVMIAGGVRLISNNHDLDDRMVLTCKPVHIKRNCWIGAGATILRGVTIGENSVVGAASVVTKDVPDNVIVAGNPAKIIREIKPKQ